MGVVQKIRLIACCLTVMAAGCVITSNTSPAWAGDDSASGTSYYAGLNCRQLWYERNNIFASNGFCFKSRRGIATFGRRCFPPYGRLPGHLRRVVNEIKGWERHRGC